MTSDERKRYRTHVVPPVPAAVGLVRVVRDEDACGGYCQREERAAERRRRHPEPHKHTRPGNQERAEGPAANSLGKEQGERLAPDSGIAFAVAEVLCLALDRKSRQVRIWPI